MRQSGEKIRPGIAKETDRIYNTLFHQINFDRCCNNQVVREIQRCFSKGKHGQR